MASTDDHPVNCSATGLSRVTLPSGSAVITPSPMLASAVSNHLRWRLSSSVSEGDPFEGCWLAISGDSFTKCISKNSHTDTSGKTEGPNRQLRNFRGKLILAHFKLHLNCGT